MYDTIQREDNTDAGLPPVGRCRDCQPCDIPWNRECTQDHPLVWKKEKEREIELEIEKEREC